MDGYSEISLEYIAMFVQNYGIKNDETYKEFTKAKKLKELQKRVTKARKASGKGEYN
jgi:hypothetical protein